MSKVQNDKKDIQFRLHIVNAVYGIASTRVEDLPEHYRAHKNEKDLMRTLFFYMAERDMIVLNEDNMLSHTFGELIIELLQLTKDEKVQELARLTEACPSYVTNILTILGIQEYRRLMGYSASGNVQGRFEVVPFDQLCPLGRTENKSR